MGIIKEEQQEQLKERFKELDGDVKLIVFTQENECHYCKETRQLMEDIAALSDKIAVEVYDFVADKDKVEKYMIDKIPATVIEGEKDYGIRFYGIPAGYEFVSLIGSIGLAAKGESDLSEETKTALSQLKDAVHIQVFITLTCPYCPGAVEIAHKLAIESELITADMVESAEFPHLTQKYGVMAVPKVVVNEDTQFEGALPEEEFVENVMKVLESPETEGQE
ncbi:thioredoxin family protein [Candidatus Poribacteria bacterium]